MSITKKRSSTTVPFSSKRTKLENMVYFNNGKELNIQVAVHLFCYSKYNNPLPENMNDQFDFNIETFHEEYPINTWHTENVTSMKNLFQNQNEFNDDISNWVTSNVTDMSGMFEDAQSITDLDLRNWDTSNVTTMERMFSFASNFCGNVSTWKTLNVTNMESMFSYAIEFNGDIESWDTSKVTTMRNMFLFANKFNGNLANWETSSVTDMANMFYSAGEFNGDISNWKTSRVTDMKGMFTMASKFNRDLRWNTSHVTTMKNMFLSANSFNGDLSSWETTQVTDMSFMFKSASQFQGKGISGWNTSHVTTMESMFQDASVFDENINSWIVTNVTNMSSMFQDAFSFTSVIQWDLRCKNIENMISNSTMNELYLFNLNLPTIPPSIHLPVTTFFEKCRLYGDVEDVHTWIGIDTFDIFIFYLKKKYNILCGDRDATEFNRIVFTLENNVLTISESEDELVNNFVKCIKSKNHIMVRLHIHDVDNGNDHSNLFFYRSKLKLFEHFEPNGEDYEFVNIITPQLQSIVQKINTFLEIQDQITFVPANITCPDGFQSFESNVKKPETEGYCSAWSYLVMELCIVNPQKPLSDLTREFMEDERFHNDPLERGKYLSLCIQGYVRYINDTYIKYFSILSNGLPMNDFILEPENNRKGHISKVPDTPEYVYLRDNVAELLFSLSPNFHSTTIQIHNENPFTPVSPEKDSDDEEDKIFNDFHQLNFEKTNLQKGGKKHKCRQKSTCFTKKRFRK